MKNLIHLLLLLVAVSTQAQDFKVNVSEEFKLEGNRPFLFKNQYYRLESDIRRGELYSSNLEQVLYRVKLTSYNQQLQVIKEQPLSNNEKAYGPIEPFLKVIDDKLYFLYSQIPEKKGAVVLKAALLDPVTLTPGQPFDLLSFDQKNFDRMQQIGIVTKSQLTLKFSPDHSKLLAVWSPNTTNEISYSLLDRDFNKIRAGKEQTKSDKAISVTDALADNKGNVYITWINEKKTHSGLFINDAAGKNLNRELKVSEGSVFEAYIFPAGETAVRLVGAYEKISYRLGGVFSQILSNKDFQLLSATITPFPATLVSQLENNGWAEIKPKKYGLDRLSFQGFSMEDGSADLVGEFRRESQGNKSYAYISGDILNIRFDNTGKAQFSVIPKYRVSVGSLLGDSFYPFAFKNKMIVFYDDHTRNVKQEISASPSSSSNFKNSVLVAASISQDGTVKRDILIDLQKDDYFPIADELQELGPSSVFVPVYRIKGAGRRTTDFKVGLIEIRN